VKLGLVQFAGRQSKDANIALATEFVERAAAKGADVVCLHELATTVYFAFEENERWFSQAETVPGPATEHFSAIARKYSLALVLPLFEREGDRFYNSAAVIDTDGTLLGSYRKSVIPFVCRDGAAPSTFERYYFRAGDHGLPVFRTSNGVTLGLQICFDRHFPEHFRVLALQGADLVCVPTTSERKGEDHWVFELQAEAYANCCWVAGVNRVGQDEGCAGDDWYGQSVLVSPRGKVVAKAGDKHNELLMAEFDPAVAAQTRAMWGFFRDRRPELYGALAR
jgi:N-carbamoylputrescine amidase